MDQKDRPTTVKRVSIPMRPIALDQDGRPRFQENVVVRRLFDRASEHGYNMNHLRSEADLHSAQADWEEFLQLIGYSTSGYGELSIVSAASVIAADTAADELLKDK